MSVILNSEMIPAHQSPNCHRVLHEGKAVKKATDAKSSQVDGFFGDGLLGSFPGQAP